TPRFDNSHARFSTFLGMAASTVEPGYRPSATLLGITPLLDVPHDDPLAPGQRPESDGAILRVAVDAPMVRAVGVVGAVGLGGVRRPRKPPPAQFVGRDGK